MAGFGPFGEVTNNPAEALVRALDGNRVRGETILGHVLTVSHRTAHAETLALIHANRPRVVLGFGLAVDRSRVTVERRARRQLGDCPDVNGEVLALPRGPRQVAVRLDAARLARSLGAELSDDAGDYVCNAWLYRVLCAAPQTPVGFVHLPPTGLAPAKLMQALADNLDIS